MKAQPPASVRVLKISRGLSPGFLFLDRGQMARIIAREVLERLRALREELALNQDYLAKRVGVDRTTYVRKERGVIPITTEEWIKLAAAMDREPSYFFAGGRGCQSPLLPSGRLCS